MKKLNSLFIVILSIIIGCSSISDEDLFNSAKQKIDNKQYKEALLDFEKLTVDFPESKYYADALYEIGMLYHGAVIDTIPRIESIRKGVEYYKKAYEASPNSDYAPKALFMIGFLQANELNELEAAKEAYHLFIEKFPESELATSAQAELDNLGIPPEQILEQSGAQEKAQQ